MTLRLHQHGPPPETRWAVSSLSRCTVKDQPEPVSWINRNSGKDQVRPERPLR
jgi:hypothetical protein